MESIPIRNPFPGAVSLLVASTESTQAEARRLAGPSFPHGSLVAAEAQSAGRGRFPERRWESESGKNLLFTIFLNLGGQAPGMLPGLPIRIGVALCAAVAAWIPSPRLKWPNDLMLGDRKAGGIICEAGPSGVFAGVGLNCNQLSFPPALEPGATSLGRELGRDVDRWALLELFLESLSLSLGDGDWRRKAEGLLWKRGEPAGFSPGLSGSRHGAEGGIVNGTIEGIDGEGSLLFRVEGEPAARTFAAGELSRASKC